MRLIKCLKAEKNPFMVPSRRWDLFDAWIVEYVWRDMLMPETTDAEYVPPKRFIAMTKNA